LAGIRFCPEKIKGMKRNIPLNTIYVMIITACMAVIISSCRSSQPTFDPKDVSYLYNPIKAPINPRYTVSNQSDDQSVLSIKFFNTDLFFSEANPQGLPLASMLISAKLFNITQGKTLIDTASLNLSIIKEQGRQEYVFHLNLDVEQGYEYVAEVKILDRLRLKVVQAFVPFNTVSNNNKYNFKMLGHFQKVELFNPVLKADEYINLVYTRGGIDSLFLKYYKPFKEIPEPPAMMLPEKTLDYEPDQVVGFAYSDTIPMMFPRTGIYLFTTEREINEGYTILNMGKSYPTMTIPEEMIGPISYLATQNELDSISSALKPKLALDNFWIKCGGNIERARELIRIYYTRALYSNYYFTSYKEGWRTERGMIYMIYGPPDKVYKTSDEENWGYKKPKIKSKWGGRYSVKEDYLFFVFKKRPNTFSDNDFYLSRSETLTTFWDQAIASWRKGIVFRLDNPEDI